MIICLYEHYEEDFRGNGLGPLSDAVSCLVTRNIETGVYELDMTYPTTGALFDQVKIGSIISARPAPWKRAQFFDVRSIMKTMDGMAEIIADHVSYRLNGIPIGSAGGSNTAQAMAGIEGAQLLAAPSLFVFTTDTNLVTADWANTIPRTAMECLFGEEESIISTYGGEIDLDRFEVVHVGQIGQDRGVTIRYGKNLTELSNDAEGGLPNGILPYWHKDDVGTVYPAYTDAVQGNWNPFYEIVDMTPDYDQMPTAATLKAEAETRAASLVFQTSSLTFSFEDLGDDSENVWIGDTVSVVHPILGIRTKARIIETVFNALADRYESITAGKTQDNLAGTIAGGMSEQAAALATSLRGIIATKSIDLTTTFSITAGQAKGTNPATNVDIYAGYYPLEVVRMRASNNNISFAEARLNRGTTTTVTFGARNNSSSNLSGVTIRAIILYIKNEFAVQL